MITKRAYKNFLSNYKIFAFDTESFKYQSKGYEKQILALGSIRQILLFCSDNLIIIFKNS